MTPKLVTITFSHYCEKARWALDRVGVAFEEDGNLPMFAYTATARYRARSVPILVDGSTVLRDSTDIIAWADAHAPGALLAGPEANELEDYFDTQLGPHARRWGYAQLVDNPAIIPHIVRDAKPWQARALRVFRPIAMAFIKRGIKISPAGVSRSQAKIEAVLDRVSGLLADGRRYLVGDRFSTADLTFAALAAPVILPDQPAVPMPPREMFGSANAQIDRWRETPAGKHVLRMYRDER
ncbi:MAG TPA: glutathione S-transferase family protein [Kofleriaceae bacterium]